MQKFEDVCTIWENFLKAESVWESALLELLARTRLTKTKKNWVQFWGVGTCVFSEKSFWGQQSSCQKDD